MSYYHGYLIKLSWQDEKSFPTNEEENTTFSYVTSESIAGLAVFLENSGFAPLSIEQVTIEQANKFPTYFTASVGFRKHKN